MRKLLFVIMIMFLVSGSWAQLVKNVPARVMVYDGNLGGYQFSVYNNAIKQDVLCFSAPISDKFNLYCTIYDYMKIHKDKKSISQTSWFPFGLAYVPLRSKNFAIEGGSTLFLFGPHEKIYFEHGAKVVVSLLPISDSSEGSVLFLTLSGGYRQFSNDYSKKFSGAYAGLSLAFGGYITKTVPNKNKPKIDQQNLTWTQENSSLNNWSEYLSIYPDYINKIDLSEFSKMIANASLSDVTAFVAKYPKMGALVSEDDIFRMMSTEKWETCRLICEKQPKYLKYIPEQNKLAYIASSTKQQDLKLAAFMLLNDGTLNQLYSKSDLDPGMRMAIGFKKNAINLKTEILSNSWERISSAYYMIEPAGCGFPDLVEMCYALIRKGDTSRISDLKTMLTNQGNLMLANTYYNCGQKDLQDAALVWAKTKGFTLPIVGSLGTQVKWGLNK
ncbi:MAG: hypothetical protein RBS43_00420 [Candidatus Cloacimonas sp.]|jgi:hypothetical protein|nr:hypothetical protein [Candidatus Cloacimonas sp.]